MNKIIKLSESDLINIVKKVLKEQSVIGAPNYGVINGKNKQDFSNNNLPSGVVAVQNALMRKGYDVGKKGGVSKTSTTQQGGFIMVFAFPDYRPSAGNSWVNRNILAPITNTLFEDGGSLFGVGSGSGSKSSGGSVKMGKLGHGGCVIIQPDGTTGLFEFGRYESDDYGVVKKKNLGKIAKISNGKLLNAKQVATIAKSKTQGEGPRLRMDVAVIPLPNPKGALQYADVKGPQEYTVADPAQGGAKNCGTYALEAAIEGGVKTSFSCFASPRGVVDHVRPLAVETFEV